MIALKFELLLCFEIIFQNVLPNYFIKMEDRMGLLKMNSVKQ